MATKVRKNWNRRGGNPIGLDGLWLSRYVDHDIGTFRNRETLTERVTRFVHSHGPAMDNVHWEAHFEVGSVHMNPQNSERL